MQDSAQKEVGFGDCLAMPPALVVWCPTVKTILVFRGGGGGARAHSYLQDRRACNARIRPLSGVRKRLPARIQNGFTPHGTLRIRDRRRTFSRNASKPRQ